MLRSNKSMRLYVVLAIVFAVAAGVATRIVPVRAADDKVWVGLGGSSDNARYFDGKQITKTNVNKLEVAWNYPYGETGFAAIVAHGVIYGRGRGGSLIALDAKTGKEIWVREGMNGMTTRGINYWESKDGTDRRLIFCIADHLQEIDGDHADVVAVFDQQDVQCSAHALIQGRPGAGRASAVPARAGRRNAAS